VGRRPDPVEGTRQYRRGAVMGLTVAEAFMLLAFVLLMLMMLWRQEDAKALAAAKEFAGLPAEERAAVLATVRSLGAAGLDPADPVVAEKLASVMALGDAPLPDDVLSALARASDDERRKLEDLVRGDAWRETGGSVGERVAERLQAAAAGRAAVADALRAELGPVVARHGGAIEADGALVFPDTVLFAAGRADITPELRSFLGSVCLPWLRTLEKSAGAVSDLRIEGHASSEWVGASPEEAYLANLALSQARAHAVLSTCLALVPGPEGAWARSVATAVGYSSSHPVMAGGAEDKEKSRRVVFRVGFSDAETLEGIEREVEGEAAARQDKLRVFR
jgi:outer membrane protein OmpA-like peptidoglycan-associated protein